MPCCVPSGPLADAEAAEKLRRATLETMQSKQLLEMRCAFDMLHDLPIVDKRDIEKLSIACGPMLDVDNFESVSPALHHSRFFMPCAWAQDDLEYQSWSGNWWRKLDDGDPYGSINLAFPLQRLDWFRHCLDKLGGLCPDIWESYWYGLRLLSIFNGSGSWQVYDSGTTRRIRGIRLRLPDREFFHGGLHIYHQYSAMWVSIAHPDTGMPHSQCCVVDSADNITPDVLLRSEFEAAIAMCRHRLRGGCFTDHHTKPILITTFMRDQKARLTQAYLDAKLNKLLLRQSRLLDLSGPYPGSDAWLTVRWMAAIPVGLTTYPELTHSIGAYSDDASGLAPSVLISESQ